MISDRNGRRRLPILVSGLVMAIPAVMLALWPSWPVAIASAIILGLGFGVNLSVGQALVTQVLPSATARAKDLGVINIAASAPQVLGPAIAALLITRLGGYPTLYLSVAAITVLGSACVWKIRSVPSTTGWSELQSETAASSRRPAPGLQRKPPLHQAGDAASITFPIERRQVLGGLISEYGRAA